MSLGAQLPIRLDLEVQERLEAVAQQVGTNKSALLRLLAKTFVEQAVDADGEVHLPPNWKVLLGRLPPADGRSAAAAAKLLKRHVPSASRRGGE